MKREVVEVEDGEGYMYPAELDKLEVFRLAQDLPSISSLIAPS